MDFIRNNKDLYNELLKLGQSDSTGGLDPNKNAQILQMLSKNLNESLQSYVPPKPSQQEGFHGGDKENPAPKLYLESLQSDIDFLDYLSFANIKYNSTQLVYLNGMLPETINKNEYIQYPKPRDNKGKDFKYWINKKYIIDLLEDMQKSGKNNRLLETRIGKLIQQFSNNTGDSFNPNDRAPSDKLGQPQILDSLPKTVNLSNPSEKGAIPIYDTDLKSPNDFNGWVSRNQFTILKDSNQYPAASRDNICDFINYVYTRAYNLVTFDQDQTRKELYSYYAKQVMNVAQSHSCPIGASNKPNQTVPSDKSDKDKQNNRGIDGMDDGQVAVLLRRLVPFLPLNTRTIDFRKISVWLLTLNKVLPAHEQYETGYINGLTTKAVDYLKNNPNPAGYQFDLGKNQDDVLSIMKERGQSLQFLDLLRQIVDSTADSVQKLISVYGSKLEVDQQAYQYIINQVGHSASSYSIAQQNKSQLASLMRGLEATLARYTKRK